MKDMKNPQDRTSMEGMIANSSKALDIALNGDVIRHNQSALGTGIPSILFQECEGILILNVVEAAFVISANVGTGLLLKHDKVANTWSAPSAVGLTGVGWGFVGGAAIKDYVVFMMDSETMETLSGENVSVRFGTQASLTIGEMVGREAQASFHASNRGFGATVAFAYSQGFLCGVSLQGSVVAPRPACNAHFYGRHNITPVQIMSSDKVLDIPLQHTKQVEELHHKLELLAGLQNRDKAFMVTTVQAVVQTEEEIGTVVIEEEEEEDDDIVIVSETEEEEEEEDMPTDEVDTAREEKMHYVTANDTFAIDDDDDDDMELLSSQEIEAEMKAAGIVQWTKKSNMLLYLVIASWHVKMLKPPAPSQTTYQHPLQ